MKTGSDMRTATRAAFLATVLLATACAAVAQTPGMRLAAPDTVVFTDFELRGLAWISDDTTIALVAEPDTVVDAPPLSVTLVWTDREGEVLREHDLTGTATRGVAYDGKWLWCINDPHDGFRSSLVQLEADTLYVEAEYELPGHRVLDMSWDGTSLWLVDRDRGRLDRFDPEAEDVTRSRPAPGFSPCGVAHDGNHLWITDYATGRMDRLTRGGSRWNGTVDAGSYFRRGEAVTLHWGLGYLWVVPEGAGYAIRTGIEPNALTPRRD